MHVKDWNQKTWPLTMGILDTLAEAFQGEHETELFDALEDTFYGPGRKKGERLHDYALRVQSNVRGAGQARSTVARPSTRIPSATSGTACRLSMRGRRASDTLTIFCEIRRSTTCRSRAQSTCHRQKKQGLQQRNRKETLTWKPLLRP